MNCRSCLKINPVPQCFENNGYTLAALYGILMPDVDTDYKVVLKDIATGRLTWIESFSDDIGELAVWMEGVHLMGHVYELTILSDDLSQQILFELEGVPACCLEFETIENLTYPVTEFTLSAVECTTE